MIDRERCTRREKRTCCASLDERQACIGGDEPIEETGVASLLDRRHRADLRDVEHRLDRHAKERAIADGKDTELTEDEREVAACADASYGADLAARADHLGRAIPCRHKEKHPRRHAACAWVIALDQEASIGQRHDIDGRDRAAIKDDRDGAHEWCDGGCKDGVVGQASGHHKGGCEEEPRRDAMRLH